jgi:hypothetical protein
MKSANNQSPEQHISRPWQGTLLGVLNITALVAVGALILLVILMMLGAGGVFTEMLQGSGIPFVGLLSSMGMFLLIPLVVLFLPGIFITRGIFKGQKSAIIVAMIFTILALLGALYDVVITAMVINGILLYAEIVCLRSPFYNRK